MSLLNQYSYVIISIIVLFASLLILRRYLADRRIMAIAAISLIFLSVTGLFLLRPGAGDVSDVTVAEATIQNGKPTFLEFFSNYCAGCMAIRPVVDQIATDLGEDFNIIRVDIHTDAGRVLRDRYSFTYTPEFILFDNEGQELWRGHTPPFEEQISQVIAANIVPSENP